MKSSTCFCRRVTTVSLIGKEKTNLKRCSAPALAPRPARPQTPAACAGDVPMARRARAAQRSSRSRWRRRRAPSRHRLPRHHPGTAWRPNPRAAGTRGVKPALAQGRCRRPARPSESARAAPPVVPPTPKRHDRRRPRPPIDRQAAGRPAHGARHATSRWTRSCGPDRRAEQRRDQGRGQRATHGHHRLRRRAAPGRARPAAGRAELPAHLPRRWRARAIDAHGWPARGAPAEARVVKNAAGTTTTAAAPGRSCTAAQRPDSRQAAAGFLGKPTATMQQLMDISFRGDSACASEAIRAGMNADRHRAGPARSVVRVPRQAPTIRSRAREHAAGTGAWNR